MSTVKCSPAVKEMVEKLLATGQWTQDARSGHLYQERNGKEYRMKVQARTLRYEVKVYHEGDQYTKPFSSWVRIKTYGGRT